MVFRVRMLPTTNTVPSCGRSKYLVRRKIPQPFKNYLKHRLFLYPLFVYEVVGGLLCFCEQLLKADFSITNRLISSCNSGTIT